MLYVFVQGPDRNESCNVVGVFEGPDGLDVNKLYDQFFSQFDYRVFGGVVYPEYKGPTLTPTPFGAVASGSVHITAILPGGGSTAPDVGSPEYQKYLKACSKLRQEHQAKIDVRVAELRTKYPGSDYEKMFMSFLIAEHGFRKVVSEAVSL